MKRGGNFQIRRPANLTEYRFQIINNQVQTSKKVSKLQDVLYTDSIVSMNKLVLEKFDNLPANLDFLTNWTPCSVLVSFAIYSANQNNEINDFNDIILNNRTIWERIFTSLNIVDPTVEDFDNFNIIRSNHELVSNDDLLIPSSAILNLPTVTPLNTIKTINTIQGIKPFTIKPDSFNQDRSGNFDNNSIQDLIYMYRIIGVTETVTVMINNILGHSEGRLFQASTQLYSGPSNASNFLRPFMGFEYNDITDSTDLFGNDLGSQFFINTGAFLIDETIAVDNDVTLLKYKTKFRSERPTIELFNPVPSPTISLLSSTAIGNILLKDSIPQIRDVYNNIIIQEELPNNAEALSFQKMLRYIKFTFNGSKRLFYNLATINPINSLFLFVPFGYSIKIVTVGGFNMSFLQNQNTIDEYMTRLTDINDEQYFPASNIKTYFNSDINAINGEYKSVVFIGKSIDKDRLIIETINGGDINDISTFLNLDTQLPLNQRQVTFEFDDNVSLSNVLLKQASDISIQRRFNPNLVVGIKTGWYKEDYPTIILPPFITDPTLGGTPIQYLSMAPPPMYIWTLNDFSFGVLDRLSRFEQSLQNFGGDFETINRILFESMLNNDLSLSIIANNVNVQVNTINVRITDLSFNVYQLSKRISNIEQEIFNKSSSKFTFSSFKNIINFTVSSAAGALALYITGNSFLANVVRIITSDMSDMLFDTVTASSNGNNISSVSNALILSQLSGFIGLNATGIFNSNSIEPFDNIQLDYSNEPEIIQKIIDAKQKNAIQGQFVPLTVSTGTNTILETAFQNNIGLLNNGVGVSGVNLYDQPITQDYLNTRKKQREELDRLLQ